MGKFKFGIIGAGVIGPFHAEAIRTIDEAELVAVASRSKEKAKAMGEKYGVDWYTDYRKLLERKDIDIVNICVPSGMHCKIGIDAAEAGKHIIAEKPIEVTLEKADRLIQTCREKEVKLAVIFQSRFEDDAQRLRKAVESGKLGRLVLGDAYVKWYRSQEYYDSGAWRGTWELDGGGALMNQSIHAVDFLQWIMGGVDTIFAHTATLAHQRIEVEDVAVATLTFKNGALGVIEGTTAAYPGYSKRIEVYGDKGSVIMEDSRIVSWEFKEKSEEDKKIKEEARKAQAAGKGASSPIAGLSYEPHRRQILDMIQAIKEDREPLVNGIEGRKSLEIILAIYHSARTGNPVKFPFQG